MQVGPESRLSDGDGAGPAVNQRPSRLPTGLHVGAGGPEISCGPTQEVHVSQILHDFVSTSSMSRSFRLEEAFPPPSSRPVTVLRKRRRKVRESVDAHSPGALALPRSSSRGAALQRLRQADLGGAKGGDAAAAGDLEVDCGGVTALVVPLFAGR